MGYVYFSQTAIIADDTCHSPFQCITKQILDSLKGDITTVFGNFFAYSFPGLVVWADNWFAWRSLVLLSFIICWSFLLQPVITGQIIDAFMQLRNSQKDATKEMEVRVAHAPTLSHPPLFSARAPAKPALSWPRRSFGADVVLGQDVCT